MFFTKEQLEECRKIDLLSYLTAKEPHNLIKVSATEYATVDHDSLKISNGKWMWWSQGFGGHTALDYLIKVRGMPFKNAVEAIIGTRACPMTIQQQNQPDGRRLILPDRNDTNVIMKYYLAGRCIGKSVIDYCLEHDLIYESLPYHSIIFLGKDENDTPRYAAYRGTGDEKILGDCAGSDKRYSFRIGEEKSHKVHVFESAIDLLSYAELLYRQGKDFTKTALLSLGGIYCPSEKNRHTKLPKALVFYLEKHPWVNTIYLHLDNDRAGWLASKSIQEQLNNKLKVVDNPTPYGKDVNDFLCLQVTNYC